MNGLLVAALALLASVACARSPLLESEAQTRVAQIERSCTPTPAVSCISHAGFASVQPVNEGDWYAEVLFASTEPMTVESAVRAWLASPSHNAILTHPGLTWYGYAQSAQSVSGWWYAVMLVEAPR